MLVDRGELQLKHKSVVVVVEICDCELLNTALGALACLVVVSCVHHFLGKVNDPGLSFAVIFRAESFLLVMIFQQPHIKGVFDLLA